LLSANGRTLQSETAVWDLARKEYSDGKEPKTTGGRPKGSSAVTRRRRAAGKKAPMTPKTSTGEQEGSDYKSAPGSSAEGS